ncbi:glycosyltransferase family 9 protein [Candidatus Marifrigoribacter sp. Uisw_064]|uniref:glycosyltransferase family 9 protein n=1 Tax=Candidatus Marifrigoribacter sp. Uisw_064 TaxID=3230970 RepID=UPI003D5BDD81
MKKPKHILVIRLSAMGDVAMSVPVLTLFSETYPDVQLTVLSKPFFRPFFEDTPTINFLEADVYGQHKGLGLLQLAKQAKNLKIDGVADLHNVIRSKIITKYLNLKGVKTAAIDKGRSEKKQLTQGENFKPLKTSHQRYADVFEDLGYPLDLSKPVQKKQKNTSVKVKELLKDTSKKSIGIAPFAAYTSKMYPLDLMQKVIASLDQEQKFNIFLFGGGTNEKEVLANMASQYSSVTSIVGKLTLTEELELISNLDIMLSMDSGNGHLAAMFGLPVITLWGVTHPFAGFAPFGQAEGNSILSDREQFPFIPTSIYGNKFPAGYEEVMKTIEPKTVVAKIIDLL